MAKKGKEPPKGKRVASRPAPKAEAAPRPDPVVKISLEELAKLINEKTLLAISDVGAVRISIPLPESLARDDDYLIQPLVDAIRQYREEFDEQEIGGDEDEGDEDDEDIDDLKDLGDEDDEEPED